MEGNNNTVLFFRARRLAWPVYMHDSGNCSPKPSRANPSTGVPPRCSINFTNASARVLGRLDDIYERFDSKYR